MTFKDIKSIMYFLVFCSYLYADLNFPCCVASSGGSVSGQVGEYVCGAVPAGTERGRLEWKT